MIRRYFCWIGLHHDIQHYISMWKLCVQFLPHRVLTKPMHLDILNVPFAACAVDSIGMLPTTTKDHKFTLTFICLLTSYVIAVLLKTKISKDIMMAYLKEILPKTL